MFSVSEFSAFNFPNRSLKELNLWKIEPLFFSKQTKQNPISNINKIQEHYILHLSMLNSIYNFKHYSRILESWTIFALASIHIGSVKIANLQVCRSASTRKSCRSLNVSFTTGSQRPLSVQMEPKWTIMGPFGSICTILTQSLELILSPS